MKKDTDSHLHRAKLTRRDLIQLAALSPLALVGAAEAARPAVRGAVRVRTPAQLEPTAGGWQTWLASSIRDLRPAAPPARGSSRGQAEFRELIDLQYRRGDTVRAIVQFWDAQGGIPRWTQLLLDKIKATRT